MTRHHLKNTFEFGNQVTHYSQHAQRDYHTPSEEHLFQL